MENEGRHAIEAAVIKCFVILRGRTHSIMVIKIHLDTSPFIIHLDTSSFIYFDDKYFRIEGVHVDRL